ncbi:hypothetical protein BJF90_25235 [Pseudonocardia sp. CNS-004]|nr:hypothetical protein BJF90_25235 [Pseudonocardia sp. CNS-004]
MSTDSGWNCTPTTGSSRWRTAMITPPSVRPVTSNSAGSVSGRIDSEWYRVATNGSGRPARTPVPSWWTSEVLPCRSSGARSTTPPHATPMAWWPRQTPRTGTVRSALRRITSMLAPARSGVPGPGLTSTPSTVPGSSRSTSSLRRTVTWAPSCARYCTRL